MLCTRSFAVGLLPAVFFLSGSCSSDAPELPIIALYSDRGVNEECLRATQNMFEWMGYPVEQVEAAAINGC